jgi:hypothetical protein
MSIINSNEVLIGTATVIFWAGVVGTVCAFMFSRPGLCFSPSDIAVRTFSGLAVASTTAALLGGVCWAFKYLARKRAEKAEKPQASYIPNSKDPKVWEELRRNNPHVKIARVNIVNGDPNARCNVTFGDRLQRADGFVHKYNPYNRL